MQILTREARVHTIPYHQEQGITVSAFAQIVTNPRRVEGLDINPAEDGFIIYQPEQDRVHFLNPTAVLILELCDGSHSIDEIVGLIQEAYGLAEAPVDAVRDALEKMKNEGLILS